MLCPSCASALCDIYAVHLYSQYPQLRLQTVIDVTSALPLVPPALRNSKRHFPRQLQIPTATSREIYLLSSLKAHARVCMQWNSYIQQGQQGHWRHAASDY